MGNYISNEKHFEYQNKTIILEKYYDLDKLKKFLEITFKESDCDFKY